MKAIKYCLNKQLADLCKRAVELEELTQKLIHLLPPDLASYCKIGSFSKGFLVLSVLDAARASQIRYALPELRDKLRQAGVYQLTSIKISIENHLQEYKNPKKNLRCELSKQAKKNILFESQQCSYEPLRKALINLAEENGKV